MPSNEPSPAAPDNLRAADSIVAELESRIVSGLLPDKSMLPAERDLMAEFGTSRTVIREAISALANQGLVIAKPRFRPVICKPNYATVLHATGAIVRHLLNEPGGIYNLYQSRVFVERGLVRDAAVSARKEDIAALKAALAANKEAIYDSLAFYKTDMAFHGVLYTISRNPIFTAMHQGYSSWLAPHWQKMIRSPERNMLNYQAHEAIFRAILERDPAAAEQSLTTHLESAWDHVRGTFDQSSPAQGSN